VQAIGRQSRRAPDGAPVHYERQGPEQTTLYRLVQQHAATCIAHTEPSTGAELPRFIKDKFDAFLECSASVPADAQGNVTALHMRIWGQSILAAVFPQNVRDSKDLLVFQGLNNGGGEAMFGYSVPNLLIDHAIRNPHVPPGFWRGVNLKQNAIYVACFIDEIAHATGKDPLVLRRELMKDHPKHLAVLGLPRSARRRRGGGDTGGASVSERGREFSALHERGDNTGDRLLQLLACQRIALVGARAGLGIEGDRLLLEPPERRAYGAGARQQHHARRHDADALAREPPLDLAQEGPLAFGVELPHLGHHAFLQQPLGGVAVDEGFRREVKQQRLFFAHRLGHHDHRPEAGADDEGEDGQRRARSSR
jgi:hypothetical protein